MIVRAAAALALLVWSGAADAGAPPRAFFGHDDQEVGLIPVEPPGIEPTPEPARQRPSPCVKTDSIAGATMRGDRTIELLLANGARRHLHFAADCPFPGFWGGFYYRMTEERRLCAGRDAILSRAGGQCAIVKITRERQPARRR